MRYYLDTEFNERGYSRIDLISIAIVAEDDRELYAVAADGWSEEDCNPWVQDNVLVHLGAEPRLPRAAIKQEILSIVGRDKSPQFWGYFADYDWVLFCQLFGTMNDLPPRFPMFCCDLQQLWQEHVLGKKPSQDTIEHNALNDARWMKRFHEQLLARQRDLGRKETP